jgi:hypothetical protein
MLFSPVIPAVLALLMQHAFATPMPVTPVPASSLSKRAYDFCGERGGNNDIYSSADARTFANNLQNLNPNTMHYMPHGNCLTWAFGSAALCVKNTYLFENTHISEWELGWAISHIQDHCCSGKDFW